MVKVFCKNAGESLNFPEDWHELSREAVNFLKGQEDHRMFSMDEQGSTFFGMTSTGDGYRALAVISQEEAFELYYTGMIVTEFMEILICAILFGLIYRLIKKQVVEKQIAQYQHRAERLENREKHLEKGERTKRTHRLVTRGAAIESVCELTKVLEQTLAESREKILGMKKQLERDEKRIAELEKGAASVRHRRPVDREGM